MLAFVVESLKYLCLLEFYLSLDGSAKKSKTNIVANVIRNMENKNMSDSVELNRKDKLYILKCGKGFSCLGFDVLERRAQRLANELGLPWTKNPPSKKQYQIYQSLLDRAYSIFVNTGKRMTCELHPALHGVVGERIEVTFKNGSKERFQVGRSTGWIPIYLRLTRCNSIGGEAISRDEEIVTVRQIS